MPIKLNNQAVKYFISKSFSCFSGPKVARASRVMDGLNNESSRELENVFKPFFVARQNIFVCFMPCRFYRIFREKLFESLWSEAERVSVNQIEFHLLTQMSRNTMFVEYTKAKRDHG